MIRFAVPAALLLALAAPSATSQTAEGSGDPELAAELAGLTPGKPETCISRRAVQSIRTFDNALVYVRARGRVWRNTTEGSCGRKGNDDILVFRSPSSQYCRGDIVELRSRSGGFFSGTCSLGSFVPYSK